CRRRDTTTAGRPSGARVAVEDSRPRFGVERPQHRGGALVERRPGTGQRALGVRLAAQGLGGPHDAVVGVAEGRKRRQRRTSLEAAADDAGEVAGALERIAVLSERRGWGPLLAGDVLELLRHREEQLDVGARELVVFAEIAAGDEKNRDHDQDSPAPPEP